MSRHGEIRQTRKTYWRTKQNTQDRSTDHEGAPTHDDDRHTGYAKSKSGRAEYSGQDSYELRRDIARHRGAAHPLCFTDEVMDHEFPEGFKPVNIESYDGTTDPAARIEDFLLLIHMARGDDLHAIKYLPLKFNWELGGTRGHFQGQFSRDLCPASGCRRFKSHNPTTW